MTKTPEQMAEGYVAHNRSYPYDPLNAQDRYMKNSYLVGYQAAKPEWISVKERLPEEDVAVLTYGQVLNNPPEVIGVRRRYNGDQEWKHTWESEDGFIYREDDVTHWMPLPEPPKEEADD
jgi:hypothetical protein